MMFGGRSNIVEWSRGEPESRRGQPTDPGEVGRKFFEKWESSGCNKKAHRWYASFCLSLTFRFIFGTFRSGGVARFVLRIIMRNSTSWLWDEDFCRNIVIFAHVSLTCKYTVKWFSNMDDKTLEFVTYCISKLSQVLKMSQREIYRRLKQSGILYDY